MTRTRAELLDDGAVFVLTTDPDAEWASSKFPHPLATTDYDTDGNLFQIVAVGSLAKRLGEMLRHQLIDELHIAESDPAVVEEIGRLVAT
jgi:hypothetical protein